MILLNDISKYQGDINWDIYKNNTNGVILKASEGNGYTDTKFSRNQTEARRVGLPLGYYHFARSDLKNTPEAEAAWFLKVCGELKDGEFLCLDYEATWSGEVVEWCLKFLEYVNTITKVKPFIYLNQALIKKYDWKSVVDKNYALWVAAYTYDPNKNDFVTGKWPSAAIQQWTNKQTVPGIIGDVDGNVFFGTVNALKKYGYKSVPVVVQVERYSVVYKGQVLAEYDENPIDTILEMDRLVQSLKETISQEISDNATLQANLSQQEADNAQLIADNGLIKTDRDNAKTELKEVEGWTKDILKVEMTAEGFRSLSGALQSLTSENKRLTKELTETNSKWSFRKLFGNVYLAVRR